MFQIFVNDAQTAERAGGLFNDMFVLVLHLLTCNNVAIGLLLSIW